MGPMPASAGPVLGRQLAPSWESKHFWIVPAERRCRLQAIRPGLPEADGSFVVVLTKWAIIGVCEGARSMWPAASTWRSMPKQKHRRGVWRTVISGYGMTGPEALAPSGRIVEGKVSELPM